MAILGVGIWVVVPVKEHKTKKFFFFPDDKSFDYGKLWNAIKPDVVPIGWFLVALGIFNVLLSIFRLCWGITMQPVCLIIYIVFLAIFMVTFDGAAIYYAVNRNKVGLSPLFASIYVELAQICAPEHMIEHYKGLKPEERSPINDLRNYAMRQVSSPLTLVHPPPALDKIP